MKMKVCRHELESEGIQWVGMVVAELYLCWRLWILYLGGGRMFPSGGVFYAKKTYFL